MNTVVTAAIYEQYLAGLLNGDRLLCSQIVQQCCAEGAELKDLYVNLFQQSLYQVGDLWEQHRISVAVEHLATAITERCMAIVQPQVFSGPLRSRSMVVACVADEYHQLGARMVADLAELQGWRSHFLGANTPLDALLKMLDERRPELLGLSLTVCCNLPALSKVLDVVSATFPGLPTVVGGQAFRERWGGSATLGKYSGVQHVATLDELERVLSAQ